MELRSRYRLAAMAITLVALALSGLKALPAAAKQPDGQTTSHICQLTSTESYSKGQVVPGWRNKCATAARAAAVDTPDGYHLDRSSGYYKGPYRYQTSVFIGYVIDNDNGQTLARVDHRLTEDVDPSVPQWNFSVSMFNAYGPEVDYSTDYYCGVNLVDDDDPQCYSYDSNDYADAHQGSFGSLAPGETENLQTDFSFGRRLATKFPMVNLRLEWPSLYYAHNIDDYGNWGSNWRGWDTCQRQYSTDTELCATSGDGS